MTQNEDQENFIKSLQSSFSKSIDIILKHPYMLAIDKGKISREKLEIFVCEQYHIILNDRRNFALIISKASSEVAVNYLSIFYQSK
jgi:thiaminase